MIYSFYRSDTGEFTGNRRTCKPANIAQNTPPGTTAIEGEFDRLTQRFDLATGRVVAWDNPLAAELKGQADRHMAQVMIADDELRTLRTLREAVLELLPPDHSLRLRLEQADQRIADRAATAGIREPVEGEV